MPVATSSAATAVTGTIGVPATEAGNDTGDCAIVAGVKVEDTIDAGDTVFIEAGDGENGEFVITALNGRADVVIGTNLVGAAVFGSRVVGRGL